VCPRAGDVGPEPTDPRKLQVEQNDRRRPAWIAISVRSAREEIVECFFAISNDNDLVSDVALRKSPKRQLDIVIRVFDEEDDAPLTLSQEATPRTR
jgi:hypothetical protein